jgi:hypothetical protein
MFKKVIKLVAAYLVILGSILCYVTVFQKADTAIVLVITFVLPLMSIVISHAAFN